MDLKEKWHSILTGLRQDDIIAIFCDKDQDGITSGVILAKCIERTRGSQVEHVIIIKERTDPLNNEFVKLLRDNNVTYLFTADCALEKFDQQLLKIAEFATVVIFDHHKAYNNILDRNITIIKSQFVNSDVDPSQYCTAKLVYDMCEDVCDMSDLDWLCAIGIIGDSNYKTYKEFVDNVHEKYLIDNAREVYNTTLGEIVSLLGYAESSCSDMNGIFDTVFYSLSPEELKNNLSEFAVVGSELSQLIKDKKSAENFKDAIIYQIKPKNKLGSTLSTLLSTKFFPDKTVIVISDFDDGLLHISARRQDMKKEMNTILEESIAGLTQCNAGGHIPAAGATIKKDDKEKFLNKLKTLL